MSGGCVRTAADIDGRHVPHLPREHGKISGPGLEPALPSAEFRTRTRTRTR
ncbi:hypothetical protein [Streptomyces sp. LN325]